MVRQPFHLVEYRPWPLTGSFGALILTIGLTSWFHGSRVLCTLIGLVVILLTIVQWWRDVVREGTFIGAHTSAVGVGLS